MTASPEPLIPPECGPTLERIQSVLDRIHPASILAADPHPAACAACRDRARAAQHLLGAFAEPRSVSLPSGFVESILAGVREDRRVRVRRRTLALVGGFAAAAAVALAVWFNQPKANDFAKQDPPAPAPQLPGPAPAPQPIRMDNELAKAGDAIRESSRTITEPAANAPRMVAALTDTLLKTPAVPMGMELGLGPAGKSFTDIPDAAKTGLEPVTGTAQKAFHRLLRDVSAMQPKAKS